MDCRATLAMTGGGMDCRAALAMTGEARAMTGEALAMTGSGTGDDDAELCIVEHRADQRYAAVLQAAG